ncbi:MAG TPA: YdcF family protein [Phormidium sp.]
MLEDPTSLNTHENAVNVRKILDSQGIERRVLLVTSAIHMPRSLAIFKRQGINAIAAPTDFITIEQEPEEITWQGTLLNIIPDAGRLAYTTRALKEYVGILIYRLRGWL